MCESAETTCCTAIVASPSVVPIELCRGLSRTEYSPRQCSRVPYSFEYYLSVYDCILDSLGGGHEPARSARQIVAGLRPFRRSDRVAIENGDVRRHSRREPSAVAHPQKYRRPRRVASDPLPQAAPLPPPPHPAH